jgi:Domain of unknown function (DUF4157)
VKAPGDPSRDQAKAPAPKPPVSREREPDTTAVPEGVQPFSGWSYASVPPTAPPIVHEVLDSPGEPLDRATRASMETQLDADFSGVRVHVDDRAARSAEAVGAAAYTVGRDVVFGRGFYRPQSREGRELLAHELEHTEQEGTGPVPSELRIGHPADLAEREASAAATRIRSGQRRPERRPARGSRTPVLRRTLLGSLLGGAGGALGGALIGGLLGGPIGAVIGGVVGLVGGMVVGELATTRSRALTQDEIDYAHEIYLESVDYTKIRITRDSTLAVGAPRTIGNTIHLKSDWGHFKGDTLDLTEEGMLTLIHEMGHVWQYQHTGLAYIPLSLIAQLRAAVHGGTRTGAYDWHTPHNEGTPWEYWNPEQQAEAIEDYNKFYRKQQDGTITPAEMRELNTLLPYIEKVRRGEGAPEIRTGGPERETEGTTP